MSGGGGGVGGGGLQSVHSVPPLRFFLVAFSCVYMRLFLTFIWLHFSKKKKKIGKYAYVLKNWKICICVAMAFPGGVRKSKKIGKLAFWVFSFL